MTEIEALTSVDGIPQREMVPVYNIHDYPYGLIANSELIPDKNGYIYNIPAAFDIETSTEKPKEIAYMYHWQFCACEHVVFGRTWEEFIKFKDNLCKICGLGTGYKLVIYVHNLSYEWQFIRKFFRVAEGNATQGKTTAVCRNHERHYLPLLIQALKYVSRKILRKFRRRKISKTFGRGNGKAWISAV